MLFLYIFIAVVLTLFFVILFRPTKEQKEYERKLKESLEDEFIIDPETGAKITLEEAESGNWEAPFNEFDEIAQEELNKMPTDGEKQAETALNYLRSSKDYLRTEFDESHIKILSQTKILSSYYDWSYSNSFAYKNDIFFLPAPEIDEDAHKESYLMYWIKIDSINGHYLFREKTSSEKIFDLVRKDDDFPMRHYECFTFKKSKRKISVERLLNKFEDYKGLVFEIHDDNLFIMTLKLISPNDLQRVEKLVKSIKNPVD